jgi:hypothetical protein
MSFKKHNWMRYGSNGNILKIFICDQEERKLDSFICNNNDDYKRILKILEKYGFNVSSSKASFLDKDLEW